MKRFLVAALTLPIFLVGCGEVREEPLPSYTPSETSAPVPEETPDGQVRIVNDSYEVTAFRKTINGVDCVIAQSHYGLSMDCEW